MQSSVTIYPNYLRAFTALELEKETITHRQRERERQRQRQRERETETERDGPTSGHEVHQQALGQKHLPAAQHAAPATVSGETGPLQLGELSPVGQPQPGDERSVESLHLV